jgi:hypothetical protein
MQAFLVVRIIFPAFTFKILVKMLNKTETSVSSPKTLRSEKLCASSLHSLSFLQKKIIGYSSTFFLATSIAFNNNSFLELKFPWTSTSCIFFYLSSYGACMKLLPGNMLSTSATPYYPPRVALKAIILLKYFNISVGAVSLLSTILTSSFKKRCTSSIIIVESQGI